MGIIKTFGEYINETIDVEKGTLFNDDDFKDERAKNGERKKLIRDIWNKLKYQHRDDYLDFPQFYTVSNGEIGFIRKDEINKMTNDEKNQIYAYIKPDEDELSQEISGIITVPLDIVIYPNITVDGNHIDDLYINFGLYESPDYDADPIENSLFVYNSENDEISWETGTDFGHDLTWNDLNPDLEKIIKTIIGIINPDSERI